LLTYNRSKCNKSYLFFTDLLKENVDQKNIEILEIKIFGDLICTIIELYSFDSLPIFNNLNICNSNF